LRDAVTRAREFSDPTKFVQMLDVQCAGSGVAMKPIMLRTRYYDPPGVAACAVCAKGWRVESLHPREGARIAPEHTRAIVDIEKHRAVWDATGPAIRSIVYNVGGYHGLR
jgi:hypothetical protein